MNPAGTPQHDADIEALRGTGYRTLMLPKCETPPHLEGFAVVALCETPAGVLDAAAIAAAPGVVALMWGAEDLVAAMGGWSSRFDPSEGGGYRGYALHARAAVLLAAKAHGRQAIDSVYLDYADLDGLAAEAQDAAAVGFDLKACIHPSQAGVVRAAYAPSPEQVERARRVLAAASSGGVTSLDGQMIDAPLIRQAEQIVHDHRRRYGGPGGTGRSS